MYDTKLYIEIVVENSKNTNKNLRIKYKHYSNILNFKTTVIFFLINYHLGIFQIKYKEVK